MITIMTELKATEPSNGAAYLNACSNPISAGIPQAGIQRKEEGGGA